MAIESNGKVPEGHQALPAARMSQPQAMKTERYVYGVEEAANPQDEPPGGISAATWAEMSEAAALGYAAHAAPMQMIAQGKLSVAFSHAPSGS